MLSSLLALGRYCSAIATHLTHFATCLDRSYCRSSLLFWRFYSLLFWCHRLLLFPVAASSVACKWDDLTTEIALSLSSSQATLFIRGVELLLLLYNGSGSEICYFHIWIFQILDLLFPARSRSFEFGKLQVWICKQFLFSDSDPGIKMPSLNIHR